MRELSSVEVRVEGFRPGTDCAFRLFGDGVPGVSGAGFVRSRSGTGAPEGCSSPLSTFSPGSCPGAVVCSVGRDGDAGKDGDDEVDEGDIEPR